MNEPPKEEKPTLAVTIPDSETIVDDAEIMEEIRSSGLVKLQKGWLTGLHKIGIFAKGGISTQRGTLMVTQAQLAALMNDTMECAARIAADKKMTLSQRSTYLQRLSQGMAQLAKTQIEAVKAQVELEKAVKPMSAPLEEEPQRNQAFEPGKPVQLAMYANEVHMHEQKPAG